MMISAKKNRRYGTCGWCGRHNQKLTFTVYVIDGAYHAADVCQRCLDEYHRDLARKVGIQNGD